MTVAVAEEDVAGVAGLVIVAVVVASVVVAAVEIVDAEAAEGLLIAVASVTTRARR